MLNRLFGVTLWCKTLVLRKDKVTHWSWQSGLLEWETTTLIVSEIWYRLSRSDWSKFWEKCSCKSTMTEANEVDELKQRLIDVWDELGQSVIDNGIDVLKTSPCMCLHQRRTFWPFSLSSLCTLVFANFVNTESELLFLCAKCIKTLLSLIFCISQDRAGTRLMWRKMSLVARWLLNSTVKENRLRSIYERISSGMFFEAQDTTSTVCYEMKWNGDYFVVRS